MKSVYELYKDLWPKERHGNLQTLLSQVPVLLYPAQRELAQKVLPAHTVVVMKGASIIDIVGLLEMGFEHIVQEDREDFPQELLASSLMVVRPDAFSKNPIPFFFTGFQMPRNDAEGDRNLVVKFSKSTEKGILLNWLQTFLNDNRDTANIQELCLQSADELITNALFNAPIRPSGMRPFAEKSRAEEVELPDDKKATLFACYSDRRVVVGVSDMYGSVPKDSLLLHLRTLFKEPQSFTRSGRGGAGLGFRYLIENSANFYLLSTKGVSSLVACGFLLQGMRPNLSASKHFHFSFR